MCKAKFRNPKRSSDFAFVNALYFAGRANMTPIFPPFHPIAIVCILVFGLMCLFLGGTLSTDVLYAIDPFTGTAIALGVAKVASDVVSGLREAKAGRDAIKNLRASPEFKALSAEQKKARERQEADSYGLSAAAKRKLGIESGKQFKASVAKTQADLQAGKADPTKMAGSRELVDRISAGAADTAVKTAAAAEEQSGKLAMAQKAQDSKTIATAASQAQALIAADEQAKLKRDQAILGGVSDAASMGLDATLGLAQNQANRRLDASKVNVGTDPNMIPGSTNTGTGF